MNYTPAIPIGGYAGWVLLKRTMARQTAAFAASTELKRDEDYFRANIGKINTAEELVSDRRLLKVALGAFGLDGDINNKFFIKKVLQDGTLKVGALANRLSDKQYQKMSVTFGFGDFAIPGTRLSDFPDKILSAYRTRQFEIAVGDQNGDMRLALNAQRELSGIATKTGSSENARWFNILGNVPMRKVFEKALGLPPSIGLIDIDQQLVAFKAKARSQLGSDSITQFADPTAVDTLVRRFLIKSDAEELSGTLGSGSAALQLMQQIAARPRRV